MLITSNFQQALCQNNPRYLSTEIPNSNKLFNIEKLEKILQQQEALDHTMLLTISDIQRYNSKINSNLILHALENGVSLKVSDVHLFDDDLENLRQEFVELTNHHCQINCYLTPCSAQCFHPHFDDHDVVIIQCQGSKQWTVESKPSVKFPVKPKSIKKDKYQFSDSIHLSMDEGDCLYIPFGHVHQAQTDNAYSLHLTIGIHKIRSIDYLIKLLQQQSESAKYSVLRKPVCSSTPSQLTDLINCLQSLIQDEINEDSLLLHSNNWKQEMLNNFRTESYKPQIQSLFAVMRYDPEHCSNLQIRRSQFLEIVYHENQVILKGAKSQISIPLVHWPTFSKIFECTDWIFYKDVINPASFMIHNNLLERLIISGFVECQN